MEKNKKGTATNQDGQGSTYAGTQSPDNTAPDAYQKPVEKEGTDSKQQSKNKDLGKEYGTASSYGDKQDADQQEKPGTDKKDMVGGSPIRDRKKTD